MRITLVSLLAAGGLAAAAVPDAVDPRVRAYVAPTRVVWISTNDGAFGNRSGVQNAAGLLGAKYGQVPQRRWLAPSGCTLVNNGDPAGVLLDFGRELHGGLQIGNSEFSHGSKVRIRFGESVGEAMSDVGEKGATNDHAVRDSIYELPHLGMLEIGNTGFRFVRIDLVTPGKVTLEYVRAISLMRPMPRLGAFKSSDERLNQVWETAVRTVHLCCQDFLWDGIKRDRLVWMGDTHPETRAILAVFGAARVLPESLDYAAAITPPESAWMNGMANYTLWFLRNVHDWYFYTGDAAYLKDRRDYLKKTVEHVLAETFGPKAAYMTSGFLDWPTQHNKPAVDAGTRGLVAVALDNSAVMMDVVGETGLAARCRAAAEKVRAERPEAHGAKSAAALLALGGLRDAREMYDQVLGRNGHDGVSTFYGYYMLEAMSAAGENRRALDTVRDYWGAMIDMGATSFWEDFNVAWTNQATRLDELPVPGRKDIHGDFGEFCYPGYRHSLCHGWSAGPAAWCINRVLGLEIVEAGGRSVRVRPFLGDLDWAEGALPTAQGVVRVRHDRRADGSIDTKILEKPAGVRIVR
ncbi:MAG: alpha-L-rhamnosidase [Kiritimatiellia bacterium]